MTFGGYGPALPTFAQTPAEVARLPVQPGNSDLCFEWKGPIADAIDTVMMPKS